jgi:hypothetical protein
MLRHPLVAERPSPAIGERIAPPATSQPGGDRRAGQPVTAPRSSRGSTVVRKKRIMREKGDGAMLGVIAPGAAAVPRVGLMRMGPLRRRSPARAV